MLFATRPYAMWKYISIDSVQQQYAELSSAAKLGVGLFAGCVCYIGSKQAYGFYRRKVNDGIRRQKQIENARSIEDLDKRVKSDPLSKERIAYITALGFSQLSEELKAGKIRPIEALRAYQTKALDAHKKTNCLVEAIREAEEWALQLEKGPKEGMLWGMPISIKDDVGIKGYDSAIGMVMKINFPATEDCSMLKVLRQQGAIPFVKTNVPQTELSFEPGNPINGDVHNCHKHGYGPGGSSSGEATLNGSGASVVGFGSDLGGSIRVPAHFCGIFGFKPTPERMSIKGMDLDTIAAFPIRAIWGPLSRDMDAVLSSMRALWKDDSLAETDTECLPMGFNEKIFFSTRKLRVGYWMDNEIFPTSSACLRAVDMAKDALHKLGHELVPWNVPDSYKTYELLYRILQADGNAALKEALKYDKIHQTVDCFVHQLYTPVWLKRKYAALISKWDRRESDLLKWGCGVGPDINSAYELTLRLREYREMVKESWDEAGLDVLISPPHIIAAPPLGNSELIMRACIYTLAFNVLHYPGGTVPATFVQQDDLDNLNSDFPRGDKYNDLARKAMSDTVGLPVGVQVVSPRYQDEICLRVMKILADELKPTGKLV